MPKSKEPHRLPSAEWIARLEDPGPIAGIAGPGRWFGFEYAPVSLFSLKASFATSSVGRSLVVPTPYAIKMAFVDASFRAGLPDRECAGLLDALVGVDVRSRPPKLAVVTHTFVRIRQEPKKPTSDEPFTKSIAYRDMVEHVGTWLWAFDLGLADEVLAQRLAQVAPHVRHVGKRGSFIQYLGAARRSDLSSEFTQPVEGNSTLHVPPLCHFAPLDDFGPEANFETLSSFSGTAAKRDKHRVFVSTMIPLGVVNTGPGFTEYAAESRDAEYRIEEA
jgi:hypothetical protein